jgi:hypothetical protein
MKLGIEKVSDVCVSDIWVMFIDAEETRERRRKRIVNILQALRTRLIAPSIFGLGSNSDAEYLRGNSDSGP